MESLYTILIFFIVLGLAGTAGYITYRFFNRKIISSNTGWELLCYSLLMIMVNIILLLGSIFILFEAYAFLSAG